MRSKELDAVSFSQFRNLPCNKKSELKHQELFECVPEAIKAAVIKI